MLFGRLIGWLGSVIVLFGSWILKCMFVCVGMVCWCIWLLKNRKSLFFVECMV